jgi:hypothetical protein
LARPHDLSLIELEHNLKFQGKLEYPVSQTGWSSFDRLSLRRQRAPTMEIGTTSTQVTSR